MEIVQITERATSPPAIKVNKLDAWPPLTEPSNIKPIAAPPLPPEADDDDDTNDPIFAMPAASSGIIPKHNMALMERSFGWRHNALVRSFGVMERPMANMRIAYAVCITDNDPTTVEHHEAFQTAKPAASIVQSGVKSVNMDNLFSRALLLLLLLSGLLVLSLSLSLADKDITDNNAVLVLPSSIQLLRLNAMSFLETA